MSKTINNLPWIEKYRPQSVSDVIDHEDKSITIMNMIKSKNLTHLLFYGNPGCGKTSLILACARELYGENYREYILELNASDERGIDSVRNKIPTFVTTSSNKIKIVILDEADSMTVDAQSALKRIIELYSHTSIFCIICNNINKIIPGLQSRCQRMRFGFLQPEKIKAKINDIIINENIKINEDAINTLITHNRDLRIIINSLQCLHYMNLSKENSSITKEQICKYLSIPSDEKIDEILKIIKESDKITDVCNKIIKDYKHNEWDLCELILRMCKKITSNYDTKNQNKLCELMKTFAEIELRIINHNDSIIQIYVLVIAIKCYFSKS